VKQDIHECLVNLEDISGTRVYTAQRARKGYWMNQFAMSLMNADNRKGLKADVQADLADWPMPEKQRQSSLDRDYKPMLDLGGTIYEMIIRRALGTKTRCLHRHYHVPARNNAAGHIVLEPEE
jgi:protocatechuate 4,5-dioxygenase alpha subunit